MEDDFDDDFVFDDALLNELNKAEQKFAITGVGHEKPSLTLEADTIKSSNLPLPSDVHRGKKRKADALRSRSDDFGTPPEISVTENGTYIISNPTPESSRPGSHSVLKNDHAKTRNFGAGTTQLRPTPFPPQAEGARSNLVPTGRTFPTAENTGSSVQPIIPGKSISIDPSIALKTELEKMHLTMQQLQQDLKTSEEKQLIREGEIANLRRNLSQRNAIHDDEVTRLKQQKTVAEQLKDSIQADLTDEIARLKSRLAFKQSEIESSNRRIASVSNHGIGTQYSISTPFAPRNATMKRPNTGSVFPIKAPVTPRKNVKQPSKPAPTFPSFYNSFEGSSPVREAAGSTPKGSDIPKIERNQSKTSPERPSKALDYDPGESMQVDSPPKSFTNEAQTSDIDEANLDPGEDVLEKIRRILFSHTTRSNILTIHALLSLPTTDFTPDNLAVKYSESCRRMMDMSAATTWGEPLELCSAIAGTLIDIAAIIATASKFEVLSSLLQLMTALAVHVSELRDSLLQKGASECSGRTHSISGLLEVIMNAIRNSSEDITVLNPDHGLARCTLDFLGALCWLTSDRSSASLVELIRGSTFWDCLLDIAKPRWFKVYSFQLLALFAFHGATGPVLSGIMIGHTPDGSQGSPLISACSILAGPLSCGDDQEFTLRQSALTLLSSLSLTSGGSNLGSEESVLSSLIILLSQFTAFVWEDEEDVVSDPALALRVVTLIHQTVLVAHRVVFSDDFVNALLPGTSPLGHVLFEAPRSTKAVWTSGLAHLFVVAVGRLSYGMAPQWLPQNCKDILENTCELAHDLMESVIEGPEEDLIWSAYNDPNEDGENEKAADDDEQMIARSIELD